jgi:hypothetical protein
MTQVAQAHDAGLGYWLTIWFLGTPASGTHNLVSSLGSSAYNDLYGISLTGALTSTPTSFDGQVSGAASSITCTLSTTGNPWYFGVANGSALSGTANATLLDSSNPNFQADFDSNGIASTASMTVTRSGVARIGLAAVAIQAAAVASGAHNLAALGAGS